MPIAVETFNQVNISKQSHDPNEQVIFATRIEIALFCVPDSRLRRLIIIFLDTENSMINDRDECTSLLLFCFILNNNNKNSSNNNRIVMQNVPLGQTYAYETTAHNYFYRAKLNACFWKLWIEF